MLCARCPCTCTDTVSSIERYFVHRKNYRGATWEHNETDSGCGSVLSADSGRFTRLRWFGEAVRAERLLMDPADVMAGQWLSEAVLQPLCGWAFDLAPAAVSALDAHANWELVIQLYVSCSRQCDRCTSHSCLLVLEWLLVLYAECECVAARPLQQSGIVVSQTLGSTIFFWVTTACGCLTWANPLS